MRKNSHFRRSKNLQRKGDFGWTCIPALFISIFIIGFVSGRLTASGGVKEMLQAEGLIKTTAAGYINFEKVKALSEGTPGPADEANIHESSRNLLITYQEPFPSDQWMLVFVNAQYSLPEGFTPDVSEVENGYLFDSRAVDKLVAMLDAARHEGLSPLICSAYRTVEKQQVLFDAKTDEYLALGYNKSDAETLAKTAVAYPGTSEHNLGLAVDIVSADYQLLDDYQATTLESLWLKENCYKYGFILRYPPEKSHVTGIIYEPWHFRYVGEEAATEIMDKEITLEEYLGV